MGRALTAAEDDIAAGAVHLLATLDGHPGAPLPIGAQGVAATLRSLTQEIGQACASVRA